MTKAGDSIADAQARVDAERARIAGTIAEIRRRSDPRTLATEAKQSAVDTASHLVDTASRLADAGVETVRRRPEVAGAAVGGVGLVALLLAWRKRSKRKAAQAIHDKLAARASVNEVIDPPAMNPFDIETTASGHSVPAQQETVHGQEQHQSR